jgi:phosphate/sulfate permease
MFPIRKLRMVLLVVVIGTFTGGARVKTIAGILSAWIITLSMAAGLAAIVYFNLSRV